MSGRLLPELCSKQARLTPGAVAVADDHGELDYSELDERSGRVAAALLEGGRGAGSIVGVRMYRSVDLVVALLGIWKAGAAYVPLDPNLPEARIAEMLDDTGCELVLTEQLVKSLVDNYSSVPGVEVDATAPAYVVYTSGSTGRPKGVVITHGGIANRVLWTVETHGLGATDSVLQKTSLAFDASVWEVFAPLVSGGRVVLAPPGAERDPAAMLEAVRRHGVTVLQAVPSVWRLLVAEPGFGECTSLRLLFSAGESLYAELCQLVWAQLPGVEMWNTYGPTECAIDVTAHRCDQAQATGPVPIGKPITGARVLVLDGNGELAPIGVAGELYLGGAGLALGYLARPELTEQRFVPDPLGPAGSRLYRTGDRARWRSDGLLEYLGRLDDQLKINGVRIEPGEVEVAILAHPAVRACAVLGVPDTLGESRLVTYVSGDDALDIDHLKSFLSTRLPGYLVPSTFVPVVDLPLTTSGKVDRAVLRALGIPVQQDRPTEDSQAPRTSLERRIAGLWSQVLGIEVGVHDNFFELNGHSLAAARLVSMIFQEFGVQLAIRALFDQPTVAGVAGLLESAGIDPDAPAADDPSTPHLVATLPKEWLA